MCSALGFEFKGEMEHASAKSNFHCRKKPLTTRNEPLISLLLFSAGFLLYRVLVSTKKYISKIQNLLGFSTYFKNPAIISRLTGIVFLFVIPFLITRSLYVDALKRYGLSGKNFLQSLIWSAAVGMGLIILNIVLGKRPENLARYPQIREREWSPQLFVLSASTWIGYLFAYEYLFRGLLLFSCYRACGFWNAVALNVALYMMAHLDKSLAEVASAVPLGFLLAILTLKTGTIWAAFLIHVILALSNEWLALYYNPEIRVQWKK
jgi:membrane protease YdiL (CAAX protease family)